jgi:ATP-dependent Lhr-like helicase
VFPETRDDLLECLALIRAVKRGELDAFVPHDAPLDVLTQQLVAETSAAEAAIGEAELFAMARRAWPYRALPRADFDAVVAMAAEGFSTRKGRRAALLHRDEVHARCGAVAVRASSRRSPVAPSPRWPTTASSSTRAIPSSARSTRTLRSRATPATSSKLGNASWQILQVTTGVVRVADAKGAPPSIPFWLGEAPARSHELSLAVSARAADGVGPLGRSPRSGGA